MMVDRTTFDTILGLLNEYVGELRRLATVPPHQLLTDPDKIASVKYHFVVAIECCLDLAGHVIAAEKYRSPAGVCCVLRPTTGVVCFAAKHQPPGVA